MPVYSAPTVTVDQIRRTTARISASAFDAGGTGAVHTATEYRVRYLATPFVIIYVGGRPMYTTDDVPAEANFAIAGGVVLIDPSASATLVSVLAGTNLLIRGAP